MFASSYIGLGAAIGLNVEIPFLIRILASDMYRDRAARTRVDFDRSLQLYLDAGTTVPVPSTFEKAWWLHYRDPINDEVLGPQTIDECLEVHRKQQVVIDKKQSADAASTGPLAWIDDALLAPGPAKHVPSTNISSRSAVDIFETITTACSNCKDNWDRAVNAFSKDQRHVQQFKAVRDSFNERRDAAARRAAGFLALHHAAITKEFDQPVPPSMQSSARQTAQTPTGSRIRTRGMHVRTDLAQKIEGVRAQAAINLEELSSRPTALWSMGVPLETEDVVALTRHGPAGPGAAHSGYHAEQEEGFVRGVYSEANDALDLTTEGTNSDLMEDPVEPPLLDATNVPELMKQKNIGRASGTLLGGSPRPPLIISEHSASPSDQIQEQSLSDEEFAHDADNEGRLSHGAGAGDTSESDTSEGDHPTKLSGRLQKGSSRHLSEFSDDIVGAVDILQGHLDSQLVPQSTITGITESGPAHIGEVVESDSDVIVGPDGILRDEDFDDDDLLGGPEDVLRPSHSMATQPATDEDFDSDLELLGGPGDIGMRPAQHITTTGVVKDGDNVVTETATNDYDSDDIAGPMDILQVQHVETLAGQLPAHRDESEEETDDDDVDDIGLGGRMLLGMLLGNVVPEVAEESSGATDRSRPYGPGDFDDVPDQWFE